MSTRGALIFVAGGRELIHYNHCDSYPSGLGSTVGHFIHDLVGGHLEQLAGLTEGHVEVARQKVLSLQTYGSQEAAPMPGGGWRTYRELLNEDQGQPAKILARGSIVTSDRSWLADGLFCEWAYLMDFDTQQVEVYVGGQTCPHTSGRYALLPYELPEWRAEKGLSQDYWPVKLIRTIPFDAPDLIDQIVNCDEEDDT